MAWVVKNSMGTTHTPALTGAPWGRTRSAESLWSATMPSARRSNGTAFPCVQPAKRRKQNECTSLETRNKTRDHSHSRVEVVPRHTRAPHTARRASVRLFFCQHAGRTADRAGGDDGYVQQVRCCTRLHTPLFLRSPPMSSAVSSRRMQNPPRRRDQTRSCITALRMCAFSLLPCAQNDGAVLSQVRRHVQRAGAERR